MNDTARVVEEFIPRDTTRLMTDTVYGQRKVWSVEEWREQLTAAFAAHAAEQTAGLRAALKQEHEAAIKGIAPMLDPDGAWAIHAASADACPICCLLADPEGQP